MSVSRKALSPLILLSATLALAGCGSHHQSSSTSGTASNSGEKPIKSLFAPHNQQVPAGFVPSSPDSGTPSATASGPAAASYSMPNWNEPLTSYLPLRSNNAVMFQYYAHTGVSPNYKTLASNMDQRYRSTSNDFSQHKILKEIKPLIDRKIAEAKAHPYVYWPMYQASLANYSFKRHGFSLSGTMLITGGNIGYDNWNTTQFTVEIRNSSDFSFLPVKDKKLAKEIENFISQDDAIYVRPYLYVNGASLSNHLVKATCTAIQILGPQKQVLMTWRPANT